MPIAFDAASGTSISAATTGTLAHTIAAGDDRILFLGIHTSGTANETDIVGTVTHAGNNMTRINTTGFGGIARHYLYYIIAPTTGAQNIVISASATGEIRAACASYTGANQINIPDANTTGTAGGTSITGNITVIAQNSWLFSSHSNNIGTPSAGAGVTARFTNSPMGIGDSNNIVSPGAQSMRWDWASSGTGALCMISFAPSGQTSGLYTKYW